MDKNKFAELIIKLRKDKNLTQKELAEKLFVTDKAVSKWERGLSFPDITILKKISEVLDISISELLNCEKIEMSERELTRKIENITKELKKERRIKWAILSIIAVILISIILFLGIVFLETKMHTYNPIRGAFAYIQVKYFNKEYSYAQKNPLTVIYGNSEFNIEKYMNEREYKKLKNTIKSGDDLYINEKMEEKVFITRHSIKGIYAYKFESKIKYDPIKEKEKVELYDESSKNNNNNDNANTGNKTVNNTDELSRNIIITLNTLE